MCCTYLNHSSLGRCKSHGAASKRCDVEDCHKVAVINGMCRRHAQSRSEEAQRAAPKPQEPPFSPIVHRETSNDASSAARYHDSEAATGHQNSSVIAQNNYIVQNRLRVIEAQRYQQPPQEHQAYGHYPNYPQHQYPYPPNNPNQDDKRGQEHPRYYYG